MSAFPTALDSSVKILIDGAFTVEAVDFSIDSPLPAGVKFGPLGPIGEFFGQAPVRVNFTFAVVSGKAQFETLVKRNQAPKVVVFSKGASKYTMPRAFWTDSSLKGAYESGDMSCTASMICGTLEQIA